MKVTALSDIHGNLIDITEECDLICICGDISPLEIQKDYIKMTKWFFSDFYEWILKLPCSKVILTPGNHDFWLYKFISSSKMYLWDKLEILIDNSTMFYSGNDDKWYNIYATPQCKDFGNWAYMPGNDKLEKYYSNIPSNLDILLTHDSPQIGKVGNILEDTNSFFPFGRPAGNEILASVITVKKPKYVLSGHIHSGDHNVSKYNDINLVNVSILNENYEVAYKPLTFEI
ncbi:MAG: metallophosphoesterase [Intestinibacter sp.]|uniref:metallophosphoesterase family protein n=1 Tax=Intestinibacter sp. TaxID=1965304 RepID=UPI003F156DAA